MIMTYKITLSSILSQIQGVQGIIEWSSLFTAESQQVLDLKGSMGWETVCPLILLGDLL